MPGAKLGQSGLKVRGRAYLRLIYGPDYTQLQHLSRLRDRHLGAKRSLAVPEGVSLAPALFLADHPVTGGYPVTAVVTEADVDLAAQAVPDQTVRISLAASPLGWDLA